MSVKTDVSGRRYVEVEVEVAGTPEQVWEAIATGSGVSSWFVPCEIDGREGGRIACRFGPGMDSLATIVEWEPPRHFTAESGDLGPDAPKMISEWTVESLEPGRCSVRVMHALETASDAWDGHLAGAEAGWPGFFRVLRLYLAHFRGEPCTTAQILGFAAPPESEAWESFAEALDLSGATVGERRETRSGAPRLGGEVEHVAPSGGSGNLLLRIDDPCPGVLTLASFTMGEQVCLMANFYLYGEHAITAAAKVDEEWRAWMAARSSMPLS